MRLLLPAGVVRLHHGEILRIDEGRGWQLRCIAGQVLYSQAGCREDGVLAGGMALDLAGRRLLLVEAWGEATLVLQRLDTPRWRGLARPRCLGRSAWWQALWQLPAAMARLLPEPTRPI